MFDTKPAKHFKLICGTCHQVRDFTLHPENYQTDEGLSEDIYLGIALEAGGWDIGAYPKCPTCTGRRKTPIPCLEELKRDYDRGVSF